MGAPEGSGFLKMISQGRGVMTHSGDVPGHGSGGHGASSGPLGHSSAVPGAFPAAERWAGQVPHVRSGLFCEELRGIGTQNRRII